MKNQQVKRFIAGMTCAAVLIALPGCAWSVGGSKATPVAKATKGEELIELKKARDFGAISEEEYNQQKQKILAR